MFIYFLILISQSTEKWIFSYKKLTLLLKKKIKRLLINKMTEVEKNNSTMLDFSRLKLNEATRLAKETTDVDVIIALSKHPDAMVRKKSLVEMCPCRVRLDIDKFWARVFEMIDDVDPIVRAQVR